jgi:arylsulfatase A-like enzyme
VIVILADDLGYGDTSLFDGWVRTPQLERMAAEGLTFTDFHTNSSVCSPTRAAFLTGRYQQRVGIIDVIARHLDTPGLEASELTIPRLMKQSGYRTALFGKWHLGTEPRHNPVHHGFDQFVGYLNGAADYHNHNDWYNGLQRKQIEGYTTHLITDHSVQFIRENKDRPFFLYVAHEAVHLPFQTPADTLQNRSGKKLTPKEMWDPHRIRPLYKIMLEEMDKGIGQILDTVQREGIAENTFFLTMGPSGPAAPTNRFVATNSATTRVVTGSRLSRGGQEELLPAPPQLPQQWRWTCCPPSWTSSIQTCHRIGTSTAPAWQT